MPGDIAISGVRILLIDDDPEFCSLLNDYLELNSISLTCAHDGQSGLDILDRRAFDLILLDMFLPDINGLDVLRRIRRMQSPPVVMLSAHNEETDRIIALEIGADDYVPKTFSARELLARIRAALRHGQRMAEGEKSVYNIGGLQVDTEKRIVRVDGREVHLTQIEYKIVTLLCRNAGKVLTHDSMIREVWGPFSNCDTQLLRVNMANIRRKIEKDPAMPEYILTEIGVGYRMAEGLSLIHI